MPIPVKIRKQVKKLARIEARKIIELDRKKRKKLAKKKAAEKPAPKKPGWNDWEDDDESDGASKPKASEAKDGEE